MLQKTITENFLTGKRVKNVVQALEEGRNVEKWYIDVLPELRREEWVKRELGKMVCGGEYDEKMVRERVERVKVLRNGEIEILLK